MRHDLRLLAFLTLYRYFFLDIHRERLFIHTHELTAKFLSLHKHLHIMAEVLLVLHLGLEGVGQTHAAYL